MIRRRTMVPLLILAGFLTLPVQAGEALKVVTVDLEKLISRLPGKVSVEADLKRENEALRAQVDAAWEELRKLNVDFKKREALLNPAASAKLQEELLSKERALSERWNKAAEDIRRRTEKAARQFSTRVENSIRAYAQGEELDLVFDRKSGRLIYAAERFDRTEDIMARLIGTVAPIRTKEGDGSAEKDGKK